MNTASSLRGAGSRGATLIEVLISTALSAATLSVFFAGALHVSRAWVETRPMIAEGVITAENLDLQMRNDVLSAGVAWAWDGTLTINGSPFPERTWGTDQPVFEIPDANVARASLAAWYGGKGKVLGLQPPASNERVNSCLVLGVDGTVIALYTCRLVEGTSDGSSGLWLIFSRLQQPSEPTDPSLVRTHNLELFRRGATLAAPMGAVPAILQDGAGVRITGLTPYWSGRMRAFQQSDALIEAENNTAIESSLTHTIRPRFQH